MSRPARVLLVDHAYRVLLLHVHDPDRPARRTWWELPALAELLAETGGRGVRVGPCVWVRRRGRLRRLEPTHVAWADDPRAPRAEVPAGRLLGERWWALDELAASDDAFDPPRLPALAPAVVRGEYGAGPAHLAE